MPEPRIGIKDGRKPGWHWADNKIIDAYGAKLKPYGLAIYYALCRHANQNGECWPSYTTLAEETGMSRDKAMRTVKELLKLKLIEKQTRQYARKGPASNLYILVKIPTLVAVNDQGSGCERPDLVADNDPNNNNMKKNKRRISTTEASLFDKSTDNPKEDANDSVSDKEKVLRDFGLRGSVVAQIAESHDMIWIRKAMAEMDRPEPGSVVYLHREGWKPPSEVDDTITSIYCSECGDLENLCTCSDPKPRRVLHSELKRLQERKRADALGSAAVPDPDRLQRFSNVHKRFPDTPHELLEFEARLKEQ